MSVVSGVLQAGVPGRYPCVMTRTQNPIMPPSPSRRALVFGGSGQIGERLLQRLVAQGWSVHAASRQTRTARHGVEWWQGDLADAAMPPACDVIFSCGPLDLFARWYARVPVAASRVVAFGSTSLQVKQASSDPYERDLAQRLADAERSVFDACALRGAQATLLRPTLVYGAGRDLTVSRIAAMATRSGMFALPSNATGLRQPVHVDDLADAALAVVDRAATHGARYALGGGERLAYMDMVQRVLAASPRRPRLLKVPSAAFALALRAAHAAGKLQGMNQAALQRMREDLVFDIAPAQRDFGYAPRGFAPSALELGLR